MGGLATIVECFLISGQDFLNALVIVVNSCLESLVRLAQLNFRSFFRLYLNLKFGELGNYQQGFRESRTKPNPQNVGVVRKLKDSINPTRDVISMNRIELDRFAY